MFQFSRRTCNVLENTKPYLKPIENLLDEIDLKIYVKGLSNFNEFYEKVQNQ